MNAKSINAKATARPAPPAPTSTDRRALRAGAPETLLEAAAETAAVGVVTDGTAVRAIVTVLTAPICAASSVDRVEQRQNILLERKRDVGAGKTSGLNCVEQLGKPPARQAVDVHQMIVAVDSRPPRTHPHATPATATP